MSANELTTLEKYVRQLAFIEAYKLMLSDEMIQRSNSEKIIFLSKLGFSVDDIAEIVDTTVGTVRKEISVNKSKRGKENGKNNPDKL